MEHKRPKTWRSLSLPHISPIHRRLAIYCSRWGGKLLHLKESDFDAFKENLGKKVKSGQVRFFGATFTDYDLGFDWWGKTIVYGRDARWADIIHEMGHVFASKDPPPCPEFEFFGWEYTFAKIVGDLKTWERANWDYGIAPWTDLKDIPKKRREKLYAERVQVAKKSGLINSRGRPVAIR